MKSNFAIKSTMGLKVKKLASDKYIVWIPNYYGLIPPKLNYEKDDKGKIKYDCATGQFFAITINSIIACGIILISNYFLFDTPLEITVLTPLLVGIIGFMTLLNYMVLQATKWKVEKQLKNK